MGNFDYQCSTAAWQDPTSLQNPLRRYYDWTRSICAPINGGSAQTYQLQPGQSQALASPQALTGPKTFAWAAPANFIISANPSILGQYRFTVPGTVSLTGTVAGGIATGFIGAAFTVVKNTNGTVTFTQQTAATVPVPVLATMVGWTLFVPGTATGDSAGPFNAFNAGFYEVVSVTTGNNGSFTCLPLGTQQMWTEGPIAITTATQIMVYDDTQSFSPAHLYPGDTFVVQGQTATYIPTQWSGSWTIVNVTPTWFEVNVGSSQAYPVGTYGTLNGTANYVAFFSGNLIKYLRAEFDQLCSIAPASGNSWLGQVFPTGYPNAVGWVELGGSQLAGLTLTNLSNQVLNLTVLTVW